MRFAGNRMMAYVAAMSALALMIVSTPVDVQAQSGLMRVQIPFQFHVGNSLFPAGAYIVQKTGEVIRVSGDGRSAMVMTTAVWNRSAKGSDILLFNRYGSEYFLSEVRWGDYSTARGLIKTRTEIQIARSLSAEAVVTAANHSVTVPPGQ